MHLKITTSCILRCSKLTTSCVLRCSMHTSKFELRSGKIRHDKISQERNRECSSRLESNAFRRFRGNIFTDNAIPHDKRAVFECCCGAWNRRKILPNQQQTRPRTENCERTHQTSNTHVRKTRSSRSVICSLKKNTHTAAIYAAIATSRTPAPKFCFLNSKLRLPEFTQPPRS